MAGHRRELHTVFGEVVVTRLAHRRRGHANLHPADAALNLPAKHHLHGLRRPAALEAGRGAFTEGQETIERATGQRLGKRQLEGLCAQPPTSTTSTRMRSRRPTSRMTCSSSPATARASSCARRATGRHGRGRRPDRSQAGHLALHGREAQPQAHGGGRQRLRCRRRSPHARRLPGQRSCAPRPDSSRRLRADRPQQVASTTRPRSNAAGRSPPRHRGRLPPCGHGPLVDQVNQ